MSRVKTNGKPFKLSKSEFKWVTCRDCEIEEVRIDSTAEAGVCWKCVQRMAGIPDQLKKPVDKEGNEKIKRHRGWKFMKEYVDSDGNVFFRGVEQPELKGTMKPTVVEPKKKKTAFEKEQERQEKEAKLAKKHQKKLEKINGKPKKRGPKTNGNGKAKYANKPKGTRNKK